MDMNGCTWCTCGAGSRGNCAIPGRIMDQTSWGGAQVPKRREGEHLFLLGNWFKNGFGKWGWWQRWFCSVLSSSRLAMLKDRRSGSVLDGRHEIGGSEPESSLGIKAWSWCRLTTDKAPPPISLISHHSLPACLGAKDKTQAITIKQTGFKRIMKWRVKSGTKWLTVLSWKQSDASTGTRGTGGLEEANRGVAKVKTTLHNAMLKKHDEKLLQRGDMRRDALEWGFLEQLNIELLIRWRLGGLWGQLQLLMYFSIWIVNFSWELGVHRTYYQSFSLKRITLHWRVWKTDILSELKRSELEGFWARKLKTVLRNDWAGERERFGRWLVCKIETGREGGRQVATDRLFKFLTQIPHTAPDNTAPKATASDHAAPSQNRHWINTLN